jgi:hypothetical protein
MSSIALMLHALSQLRQCFFDPKASRASDLDCVLTFYPRVASILNDRSIDILSAAICGFDQAVAALSKCLQLPADDRDKMLQWRQAVTRKKTPTTSPPIPPTAATKLSPEGPFKSARCRLTIMRIPRSEKPRDRLTKLIVVHIFGSGFRWNSRSDVSFFGPLP